MRITQLPTAADVNPTDYLAIDDGTVGTRKVLVDDVIDGFVSYAEEQTITTEQAETARSNIGAMAAGATPIPAAHASSHAAGGSDEITPADIGAAPATHASTHATGGSDPITPSSIGAMAADATPTPAAHASTHQIGGADPLPAASTAAAGLVQLYDGIDSTSTTLAATAAAVKAAYEHGGTGRNLLDNWYFKNPVNQRGQSSYSTTGKYTIDRWKLTSGSVTVGSSGITLNGTLVQILEKSIGLTVVCSALLSDGTMITPTYNDSTRTFTLTAANKTIIAAKLEVGTAQTLAVGNSGSMTLIEIPNISEQLERCQRFYYRMNLESWQLMIMGICSAVRNIAFTIPFPRMHAAPTMSSPNTVGLWSSGGTWATAQSFTVKYSPNSPNLSFDVYPSVNTTVGIVYAPVIEAGGYIEFNADL